MDITKRLNRIRGISLTLTGLGVILIIGFFDSIIGSEISISPFYLAPICVITWYVGRRAGILMVVASSLAWFVADRVTMDYSHFLIIYWNTTVRGLMFLFVVILLSKLRDLKINLEGIVDEKVAALSVESNQRKLAEQVVRESEQRYRSVVEQAGVAIICISPALQVLEWNRAAESLLGWPRNEILQRNFIEICVPIEVQPLVAQNVASVLAGQASEGFEYVVQTRDGRLRNFIWNSTKVIDAAGASYGVITVGQDITESKSIQLKIAQYQERLRSLASAASLAEERERRRLATDLHDGLSQMLNLTKVKLSLIRNHAPPDVKGEIGDAVSLVESAEQTARSLTFQLSPPALYDLGFLAATEWLVEDMRERYSLDVAIDDDGEDKPLDESTRVILFRSVREALINVAKHAKVGWARLSMRREGRLIRVAVEDDGVGFDPVEVAARSTGHGFGLFSIGERLEHLGGKMALESALGHGSTVVMEAPLSAGAAIRDGYQYGHQSFDR